jgi:hypothetical protein
VPEPKPVHVDAARRNELRQVAERLGERRRLGVGVDEDERAPGLDRELVQTDLVDLQAGLLPRTRRGPQAPVEPVGPGVVAALQRLAVAASLDEDRAAVPADVEEGVQLSGAVVGDDHGYVADPAGEVVAGRGHVIGRPCVLPGMTEDALLLSAQQLGLGVPAPRQRRLRGSGGQTGHDDTDPARRKRRNDAQRPSPQAGGRISCRGSTGTASRTACR